MDAARFPAWRVTLACALIRRFEGLRLTAYPDPASGGDPWTVGYGATGPEIRPGTVWTREQAEADLAARVAVLCREVRALVKVPLPDASTAALVSFAYNVGVGALAGSRLLSRLNAGDTAGAANQFPRWNKAAGRVNPGLVKRRAEERKAFLAGLAPDLAAPVSAP
jgi:lysozyme